MVILSRRPRPVPLVALGYIALTLAYTWPLPRHLFDGVPHDLGDPILNAWILWWSTKAVPLTTAWWNAPIFHPAAGTFAFSEHLLGLAPTRRAADRADRAIRSSRYNVVLLASYLFARWAHTFSPSR